MIYAMKTGPGDLAPANPPACCPTSACVARFLPACPLNACDALFYRAVWKKWHVAAEQFKRVWHSKSGLLDLIHYLVGLSILPFWRHQSWEEGSNLPESHTARGRAGGRSQVTSVWHWSKTCSLRGRFLPGLAFVWLRLKGNVRSGSTGTDNWAV